MSEEMEAVKTEDLPLDGNSIKKGEEDDKKKKKKKSPSDDAKQDESEEPKPKIRSKPKLFEPEILEGKREKKIIQRLDLMSKPKEKPKIESTGRGAKLGDIVRINHSIGKLKAPLLKPLHKIVYDRPGTASTLRKNLRLFNGFPFGEESDLYNKKMEKVKRLHKEQLKTICLTLDLERSGTQIVLSERIMKFLVHPTNSGKPILKKKKKSTKDAKREKPQKKVESGKSKPIVTDSSSDDDDDDDNDEEGKENSKDTEKSVTASQKNKDSGDKSSEKEEDDEDDDDAPEEDSKKEEKTPPQKKSSTTKSTKKSEMSEQTASDESDQDVHKDKNAKKTKKPAAKRKAPAKPVPKTKKADSSSNRGGKKASKSKDESESSDDDQPLIKMIKKPPTEEQLEAAIKDLLKDANLEEVTMKQITRQVYDKYPDFDLTSRKEFIKERVKGLVS
ncbi:protein DEK-like [Sinocyclocheilus anshuiensis]|uniref:Protein DEK n=1 Tax=Sinocyclocheilus anshuiensis TaxID=1608454 RepID=A0A671LJ43_9TELE|nr:PREDICTED: protein DEK-like [Sinocyclocheilus anshuiensis]XP_016313773.1 PREDICTED: protein DEK-like [Sinocyclocheilus anshuiensis]XP_016313774.1 PREDICTED: protein DEK-like [Sinocyclocheilus anshuiensis]XP_016313775.1 PREDICTED: protein DEK-like [Sinocyclocheilus anshuiensis]